MNNASSDATPNFIKEIEAYDREQEEDIRNEKKAENDEKQKIAEYLDRTSRRKAVESLQCSINTIQQGFSQVWKSGIKSLDDKLDGGFHPKRLVLLGGIASLGKTSLALQIADNVARSGRDVLIFSLEMSSDELLAKSISRESYLLSCGIKSKEQYRLTTQDILSGRIGSFGSSKREMFDNALQKTQEIDDHLFYFIGNNDVDIDKISEIVDLHKKTRNQSPLVILDYLQILRPTEDAKSRRLDKRLLTDDDVTKLKVLARENEIPVIALSAFNRDGYLQTVATSSFKESSGIEYSSDVLLGMQYMNMEYKKHYFTNKRGKRILVYESKQNHELRVRNLFDEMDRAEVRPLELKILKNRNGRKGSVFLDFVAPYNCFVETGTDEKKPIGYQEIIENDDIESDYTPFDDDVIDDIL